ncbi:MAG: PepSY-associated TM helix domain-containing protein [Pseudomonadota bacterium]
MVDAAGPRLASAPAKARRKASRVWWAIHQWVGLKLSIFLSFVLLTGTIAVFSSEIDWLLRPAMRVDPATISGPVEWAAVAQAVARHAPEAEIAAIDGPIDRGFAAATTIKRPDGSLAFVYAHPTSGAVQGDGHWVGAKRIFRNMHRHLFLPVKWGVPIVSSMAFLMAVSLGTAFVVYKKWWRGFLRPIRMTDARTAFGDYHRLAGVWSLWFVLLMVLTGVWYMAESLGLQAPPHPRAKVEASGLTSIEAADRLAASLAAAQAASPGLRIERVQFPTAKSGAFVFHGKDKAILVRARSNTVWTEAATGKALLTTDGRDLSVHQRISEMADPLHFGTWGGLPTKIAWFAFGLLLTGLSVSGVAIYSLRLLRAERRPQTWRASLALAWSGMGRWRWLALALVITAFVLLPGVFDVGGD